MRSQRVLRSTQSGQQGGEKRDMKRNNVQLVILHECLVVANYKFVTHRCQDSNLIGSLLSAHPNPG